MFTYHFIYNSSPKINSISPTEKDGVTLPDPSSDCIIAATYTLLESASACKTIGNCGYVFVSPVISAQEERLDVMNENQSKVDEYLSNINTLEARVKELEPRYKKSSKLFHSKKEVEDLYQNISNYAMTNGLSIINIKKGEPEPAGEAENSGENTEGQQALYYKIPVNYKIQGNYLGYLKFRRALSKSSKVINYDKETITVDAKSGTIISEGTISIVGLPDEYNK